MKMRNLLQIKFDQHQIAKKSAISFLELESKENRNEMSLLRVRYTVNRGDFVPGW